MNWCHKITAPKILKKKKSIACGLFQRPAGEMKKEQLNLDMSNFSYNVCFSYQVRAGAWLGIGAWPGGSKWEAIIWSAAVENGDHDDEGHSLLGFKRGW